MIDSRPRARLLVLAAPVLFSAVGCCSGPQAFDVEVSIDRRSFEGAEVPTVEVDVIPVSASELSQYQLASLPVDKWFTPGERENSHRHLFRDDQFAVTWVFSRDSQEAKLLSAGDPLWERRLDANASSLVVIASLIVPPDWVTDPLNDPRRLVLPLDCERWPSDRLEIEVRRDGLRCKTPLLDPED